MPECKYFNIWYDEYCLNLEWILGEIWILCQINLSPVARQSLHCLFTEEGKHYTVIIGFSQWFIHRADKRQFHTTNTNTDKIILWSSHFHSDKRQFHTTVCVLLFVTNMLCVPFSDRQFYLCFRMCIKYIYTSFNIHTILNMLQ